MSESIMVTKSIVFAKKIVKAYEYLRNTKKETTISKQLLRSGTSIGANIHEANYAISKPDFIAKMQIALKECYETEYWLKILIETDYFSTNEHKALLDNCMELRRMLVATCNSAKSERVKK